MMARHRDRFEAEAARLRRRMVEEQVRGRGIRDEGILAAMRSVPRHRFVPAASLEAAYADAPQPIGAGQTISQPFIVARLVQLAGVGPGDRVLDVGTGSGYQAAVLAALGCRVWSVEIRPELAASAGAVLRELGVEVSLRVGDGAAGWPEAAPFAGILVAAATPEVPAALLRQLRVGGRLVAPVGDAWRQVLVVVERVAEDRWVHEERDPVLFVPLVAGGPGRSA